MYIFIKQNGKIIMAMQKSYLFNVQRSANGVYVLKTLHEDIKIDMTQDDFSDLIEQLKTNEVC